MLKRGPPEAGFGIVGCIILATCDALNTLREHQMANGDENFRQLFSESCQMNRHFINLHYFTFSVGAAITAGLVKLFMGPPPLPAFVHYLICVLGIMLLVCVMLLEYSISWRVGFYYQNMQSYARKIDPETAFGFMNVPRRWLLYVVWLPFICTAILCLMGTVAWFYELVTT
jgi:hypothetical protein